jgi:hypothetical protein
VAVNEQEQEKQLPAVGGESRSRSTVRWAAGAEAGAGGAKAGAADAVGTEPVAVAEAEAAAGGGGGAGAGAAEEFGKFSRGREGSAGLECTAPSLLCSNSTASVISSTSHSLSRGVTGDYSTPRSSCRKDHIMLLVSVLMRLIMSF